MKFENTDVYNFENSFRGLRHPMESYIKSDSKICYSDTYHKEMFVIGPNDLDLAQRMIKAGSPNDKFLRQIFVSIDITGPLFWWKELDTYKVGTTANSTSTMHKLATTPITIDCFETDDMSEIDEIDQDNTSKDNDFDANNYFYSFDDASNTPIEFINFLESLRLKYLETKDKRYWKELIRWLPESWLQTRTFTCNYSVLRNIIHWRQGHKLSEWGSFIEHCRTLPYAEELLFYNQSFEK